MSEILEDDPKNEEAWLWMTQVVSSTDDRIKCLQNVLKINANHEIAQRELAKLQAQQTVQLEESSPPKKSMHIPLIALSAMLLAILCIGLVVGGYYWFFSREQNQQLATENEDTASVSQQVTPTRQPTDTARAVPTVTPTVTTPAQTAVPTEANLIVPEEMADIVWRWGDINLEPGSRGILITDWDTDNKNEVFTAHQSLITVIQHDKAYEFFQRWVVPAGLGWGFEELNGDTIQELWVLQHDGTLIAYQPFDYQAQTIGQIPDLAQASSKRFPEIGSVHIVDLKQNGDKAVGVIFRHKDDMSLRMYSLPDLQEVWRHDLEIQGRANGRHIWQVGQVDDDPALEIVVGSGVVIDLETSVAQWTYNDGFGENFQLADIDADGKVEVIGGTMGYLTAFDIDLRAPKWQFEARAETMKIADIDDDNVLEIIASAGQTRDIHIYSTQTQELISTIYNPQSGVSGIAVGDADNSGELDIAWGAGWSSTGPDEFYLTPVGQDAPKFTFKDYIGPYRSVALQMDDDAPLEIIIFIYEVHSHPNRGGDYFIIDSATGRLESDLTLEVNHSRGWNRTHPVSILVNVDNDPFQELLLAIGRNLYLLDQDGSSLVHREFEEAPIPKWVGDIDNDGQLEVVSMTANQINIHRLDTLAYKWQSIKLERWVQNVDVGDIDQDGIMEIVFHGPGSYLQAYDGKTHQLEWQMPKDQQITGLAIGNVDSQGPLEIAVVENGLLTFYNGLTRERINAKSAIWQSEQAHLELIHLTDTTNPQLIIRDSDHISIYKHAYDQEPVKTIQAKGSEIIWADIDNDQQMDLLVGDLTGITRYEMKDIFADVTMPRVHSPNPANEADRIGQNAFVWIS
ncbi:MAG: FG-GAP-like repeat-containing protein, partial [Chloroflexota bacterium]